MNTTIIVMAKAPVAGQAKTRLIPALGAAGAAALAERLLDRAVRHAVDAAVGPVVLSCAPDTSHPAFARQRVALVEQGGGDLGARMAHAFDDAFVQRLSGAVLMTGTDAPSLDATVLRQAAGALSNASTNADAVFVPAFDGGYALIGLRRPAPFLFDAMPWSTPLVMARTRERLAAASWRYVELAPLHDIDEPADLVHLPAGGWG